MLLIYGGVDYAKTLNSFFNTVFIIPAHAQEETIRGKVTDSDNKH
jgi:hypothetical protein